MKRFLPAIALVFFLVGFCIAAEKLTYVDLVQRLMDLERLSTLPERGETCTQFSSYDRASKYDSEKDKYINWSANSDGRGVVRRERRNEVFAEMKGPGVIWRIWSARTRKGHVKIYLDGNKEPVVDLPFEGYFNGENAPFNRNALVYTAARGQNCYIPIPYQESCKIVGEPGWHWGKYYHFTYTTFPEGTILPTFDRKLSRSEADALDDANEILSNCGKDPAGFRKGSKTLHKTIEVDAGETKDVFNLSGPRAITALKAKINLPASPHDRAVLRRLVLKIYWDGDKEAAVWCPLGDFFGTAPGVNHYKSLPLGMTEDGFYSYWYMPFDKGAVIKLANDGLAQRKVEFELTHAPLSRPIEKLARFHAKWHRDAFLPEDPERREIDWTMLTTEGRGRYCGVLLNVWNPRWGWWGEGDEKFFVDGEKFPSTFGTGSEDYFGYAWGNPTLFSKSYHSQTISMNNIGHVSLNRWHIVDNVPFQKSFEGAIEKYFPNTRPARYDAVAYWYLSPGGKDPYNAVPIDERLGYYSEPEVFRAEGAIEGEDMEVLMKTAGETPKINMMKYPESWSGNEQLLWIDAKPGDILELAVPVEKTAKYRFKLQLTKAFDFGIAQFYWDSEELNGAVDVYDPQIILADMLDFGVRKIEKGKHVLKVKIAGTNEKASPKGYRVGIDYLLLEEVN